MNVTDLIRQYGEHLRHMARCLSGWRDADAEDLYQETIAMLLQLQARSDLNGPDACVKVATVIMHRLKSNQRRQYHVRVNALESYLAYRPSHHLDHCGDKLDAESALAVLSDTDQDAVIRSVIFGETQREAGVSVEAGNPRSIDQRLVRAKRKMRARLSVDTI